MSGFSSEAAMVEEWLRQLRAANRRISDWTVYPETGGWDLLLAHRDGYQLGIEAKLSLNAKVIDQALDKASSYWPSAGPDYRGVLVPDGKVQGHMGRIATALGIRIIPVHVRKPGVIHHINLPDEHNSWPEWPCWCPAERVALPDYVPDVAAGCAAPVMLTPWKVKAIKLMILLERRGFVTRADMKVLQISPTRWCDHFNGFLSPAPGHRYVRCERTPDFRAQHPINYAEIEADFVKWAPAIVGNENLFAKAAV